VHTLDLSRAQEQGTSGDKRKSHINVRENGAGPAADPVIPADGCKPLSCKLFFDVTFSRLERGVARASCSAYVCAPCSRASWLHTPCAPMRTLGRRSSRLRPRQSGVVPFYTPSPFFPVLSCPRPPRPLAGPLKSFKPGRGGSFSGVPGRAESGDGRGSFTQVTHAHVLEPLLHKLPPLMGAGSCLQTDNPPPPPPLAAAARNEQNKVKPLRAMP
jgi:hypothetical protein